MAHDIPYLATATVAELHDLEAKVAKAMTIRGARYLHVLAPCPLGWRSAPAETIMLARLAQRSGLFPVFEAEHGEVTAALPIRQRVPVEDYLRRQGRFAHLFGEQARPAQLDRLRQAAERNLRRYGITEIGGGVDAPPDGGQEARP